MLMIDIGLDIGFAIFWSLDIKLYRINMSYILWMEELLI